MCGIAGFIDFGNTSNSNVLQKMTDALIHRGPDDSGCELYSFNNCSIGFGQRRLSILDLSPLGHQPMHFEHLTIVFNGEVYNFQEIRAELQAKGYEFTSHSDTEVILKAWHCFGPESIHRFIGMFAFVLLDRQNMQCYVVRDRAGVKPLYYYRKDALFLFASELKAFHHHPGFVKEIDNESLALFLQYSYIPGSNSIFNHTFKLLPGHFLTINLLNNQTSDTCYWSVENCYNQPLLNVSDTEAIEMVKRQMLKAYEYRMVADVPVGIFLSGGYDSTSVAALLQTNSTSKLKTFTIGFHEQQFNEAEEAKKIAAYLGTDHTEWYITAEEARSTLSKLPEIYDEPFADNSTVPTTLVSQLAAKDVKVVLSADGGDEIFAGYNKFNQAIKFTGYPRGIQLSLSRLMSLVNPDRLPYFSSRYNFSSRFEKMKLIWANQDPVKAVKYISQYITESEAAEIVKYTFAGRTTAFDEISGISGEVGVVNRMLAVDYKTFLVDNNLVKVDRATMAVSIEGREPMLDHVLLELLAKMPGDMKIRGGTNKWLLKEIVHSIIPKHLMDRPKRPFIAPLTIWFKNELRDQMAYYLSEQSILKSGVFNPAAVNILRDDYLNGKPVNHQKVWQLLVFQLWYDRWMAKI